MEFDCSLCESSSFFGTRGVCNFTTAQCECEEGFSGRDLLIETSSCFVNESIKYKFHLALLISSAVGLVATVAITIIMALRWDYLPTSSAFTESKQAYINRHNKSSATSTNNQQLSSNANTMPTKLRIPFNSPLRDAVERSTRNRKQASMVICMLSSFAFLGAVMFNHEEYRGKIWADGDIKLEIGFALFTSTSLAAANWQMIGWYYTLPDVTVYGRLLQVNPALVLYPNFLTTLATTGSIVNGVFVSVLIFAGSHFSARVQRIFAFLLVSSVIISMSFYLFVLILFVHSIVKVMTLAVRVKSEKSVDSVASTRIKQDVKTMRDTIRLAKNFRNQSVVLGTISIAIHVVILTLGLRETYFLANIFFAFMYPGFLAFPLILLKTDGGLAPYYKKIERL